MSCHLHTQALVPDADADEVFARVRDFERYADYTDAVRSVSVTADQAGTVDSDWAVNFRGGVLRWSERDIIDPVRRTIDFEQVSGDFASFTGTWTVSPAGTDVVVGFDCVFDLGIPSLEAMLNPVAIRALDQSIGLILRGLLGESVELSSTSDEIAAVGS
jgi:ribosome-associated toxin RatA of RatAB toxin-antitoxin module